MGLTPHLPNVEHLVDDLTDQIINAKPGVGALWHVWGPATGGKSTLLRQLGERFIEDGYIPILVHPPARALDSAAVAMVEVATGLHQAGVINGELDTITSQEHRWAQKLACLQDWIRRGEERIVILSDEPGNWACAASDDVHFANRAEEIALTLTGLAQCRRVVAGELPKGVFSRHRAHLGILSEPNSLLEGPWGPLSQAARALEQHTSAELRGRSPLEIRMLVALTHLSGARRACSLLNTTPTRRDISGAIAGAVHREAENGRPFLRNAWTNLALVRRPITDALIERVVGQSPDETSDAILRSCLLYREGPEFVMHWSLQLDARAQFDSADEERRATHGRLAEHYTQVFSTDDDTSVKLLAELEAFHHATAAGDEAAVNCLRPFFAEQLDVLGRCLSRDFKQYEAAADVFARACAWEPEDDYAHHYLAYNLDILARAPTDVEAHYRRALELNPQHVWWHSRWISYLVVRGRGAEARRAWSESRDALGLPSSHADSWVYENLHLWIARLLVHRGKLEFARDVLTEIPEQTRRRHPGLAAVARSLEALTAARDHGAVFPMSVAPEDWWEGPHLNAKRVGAKPLARWMPARVDAIDGDGLHLHAGMPPADSDEEPSLGFLTLKVEDFDRWTGDERAGELSAGRFVELAWYSDDEEPTIRVFFASEWRDTDLPWLFPDPARYLRTAGWVRSEE